MKTTNASIVGELISIHAQLDAWFDAMDFQSDKHAALKNEIFQFYDACESLVKLIGAGDGELPRPDSNGVSRPSDSADWCGEDFRRIFRAQLLTLLFLLETTDEASGERIDPALFDVFKLFLTRNAAA